MIYSSCHLAFIEAPTSQNVLIGQDAAFRCQHSTADTIRWRINGSLVSRSNIPDGVGLDADGLVEILTITGRLDYNGTEVECVARFDNGSPELVSNPPALLIVTAGMQFFNVWFMCTKTITTVLTLCMCVCVCKEFAKLT